MPLRKWCLFRRQCCDSVMLFQDVHKFIAKIGKKNIPSQRLFQKLAFRETSQSNIFEEITFTLEISDGVKGWLRLQLANEEHFERYDRVEYERTPSPTPER